MGLHRGLDDSRPTASGDRSAPAGFTELVATAIANAESRAQLMASRARIVAAADGARRRIERDLHNGAQQRLVSLALQLRAARAAVPPNCPSSAGSSNALSPTRAARCTSCRTSRAESTRRSSPKAGWSLR